MRQLLQYPLWHEAFGKDSHFVRCLVVVPQSTVLSFQVQLICDVTQCHPSFDALSCNGLDKSYALVFLRRGG
jgi:hypothetical protein